MEELGAGRVVYLDLYGVTLCVATTENLHPTPGAAIGVLLPQADLHLFSSETGARLSNPLVPLGGPQPLA